MFCFNCGKALPNEARFCAYCGTNLVHSNDVCEELVENTSEDLDAIYNLAKAYEFGDGYEEDGEKAFELYLEAAGGGHIEAQYKLAKVYEFGDLGEIEDEEEAFEWCLKAANNGHINAMYEIAEKYMYKAHEISEENFDDDDDELEVFSSEELECMENAKKWFSKAAKKGHKLAVERLKIYFS